MMVELQLGLAASKITTGSGTLRLPHAYAVGEQPLNRPRIR